MNRDFNSETISEEVISRVSNAKGVLPLELTPLGEQIDTDSLNTLLSSSAKTKIELRFEYEGYIVTIDEQNNVTLEENGPTTK